ncbi:unnamed protein product [Oppiella nova]|uniref:Uncharacterized protein n=1 Tax=Oppiella nova TaxID=334625 RepID=A0A7R9QII6_9ACAR|nr:unnamed protein product [Oppiella nova]CAG2166038.1 unnamed protein product [Oppiella nova]
MYSTTLHSDGLETSSLSLKFIANEKHFRNGNNMRLRCTATISRMYTMSNEALAVAEVKLKDSGLHISENLSQVRDTASSIARMNSKWNIWLNWCFCLLCSLLSLKYHRT